MNKKGVAWLLTALSLATVNIAQADEAAVKKAEKDLKYFETKYGVNHPNYISYLLSTAQIYQQNGKRKKAQALADKLIKLAHGKGLQKEVGMTYVWGSVLVNNRLPLRVPKQLSQQAKQKFIADYNKAKKEDIAKGITYLLKAKDMSKKLPYANPDRFGPQLELIRVKDKALAAKEEAALHNDLKQAAKVVKSQNEIVRLAYTYDRLAQHEQAKGKENFENACKVKQEAIAVWNKLPEKNRSRIVANRRAVGWFRSMGKDDYAKEQTATLAKLLGSNDPKVLFPPRSPCPACGMG